MFIPSLKIAIYSTARNAKRTATATVTAAEATAEVDAQNIINEAAGNDNGEGDGAVATTSGGAGAGDAGQTAVVRELAETPKPPGRTAGKKAKDKSELHSHIFDYLEKEVPDDDPLELQYG